MNGLRQLQHWFMGLEKRERLVLASGSIFLFFFISYAGIINPYFHHKQALKEQIQQQSALLAWMRPAAIRIESLSGTHMRSLPGGSLLSAVNNTVAVAGLANALQQAQQADDGTVRAQFSGADFDSLVRWLDALHKNFGITVADMSVTRGSNPGLVNVNLKLQSSTQ
ncbi:MAG TPA: type II secretion system protein M [Gammaproteobacteria bacterium]|nr:type II secretion system protein M [Gammaproteobacteria bacterium]